MRRFFYFNEMSKRQCKFIKKKSPINYSNDTFFSFFFSIGCWVWNKYLPNTHTLIIWVFVDKYWGNAQKDLDTIWPTNKFLKTKKCVCALIQIIVKFIWLGKILFKFILKKKSAKICLQNKRCAGVLIQTEQNIL